MPMLSRLAGSVTRVILLHPLNALFPMPVIPSPISTEVMLFASPIQSPDCTVRLIVPFPSMDRRPSAYIAQVTVPEV